jgi:hypothetical protein
MPKNCKECVRYKLLTMSQDVQTVVLLLVLRFFYFVVIVVFDAFSHAQNLDRTMADFA